MKRIWGNYWLDLIEFENSIKNHIEKCVNVFVGKRYSSPSKLRMMLTEAIKDCLDEISMQEHLISLNVDYNLHLDYNNDVFNGFSIIYVYCN